MTDDTEVSPDRLRLVVDGEEFVVEHDERQPGAYHYHWRSGPNPAYGFTSRRSDHGRRSVAEHETSIRSFLEQVDPATGHLTD